MARRRSFKRKLRRIMRRSRKGRKRFGSARGRTIKRSRNVYSRLKVKGTRFRTNNRKEVKHIGRVTAVNPINNLAAGVDVIWSNNGTNPAGVAWFPPPVQGLTELDVIGNEYNMRYCEVMFGIYLQAGITVFHDYFRMMVVRQRQPNILPTPANLLLSGGFWSPLNSKNFDVQYDKIFPVKTGRVENAAAGTAYGQNEKTGPMKFRFIVPLKKTLKVSTSDTQFPLAQYILAFTENVNFLVATTESSATYYFTDP